MHLQSFSERSEGALREARVYIPLGRSVVKKKLSDRPTIRKKYTIYARISPTFLKPHFSVDFFCKILLLRNFLPTIRKKYTIYARISPKFLKPTNIFLWISFVKFYYEIFSQIYTTTLMAKICGF